MDVPESVVRLAASASRRQIDDWALVLQASGIACEVTRGAPGFDLWVRDTQLERARSAIEAFEREAAEAAVPRPARVEYGPTRAGFVLAGLLLVAFGLQGLLPLDDRGMADARAILDGEVWRAVTALTLHADAGHVLANAASCALFGTLLCRALGPGLGTALLLASGAGGNLLNAWLQGPGHYSVGASTALFGAIGLLAGLQSAERWRWRHRRAGPWLPLAAALALLSMLGVSGERTDVLAHLLGLVVGVPLGIATGLGLDRPPGRSAQRILLIASVAVSAGAWSAASLASTLR